MEGGYFMSYSILLVDDEKSIRETLKIILEGSEYNTVTAKDGYEALDYLNNNVVDILITDLRMPKMNGIQLMEKALEIDPYIEVIFISAYADIKSAVKALKMGAFDYIEKSFTNEELIFAVEKAFERKKLIEENITLKRSLDGDYKFDGVIGKSERMQDLFHLVDRIAKSRANILLTGESGVGKDVFAQLIHRKSLQDPEKFIPINCGAIPENLIESELFGHEKGSFTGAINTKRGRFELAHGGTLFLDELGELPFHMQVKLLRVLEEKQIYRIGSENPINIGVRIIAATNKDLMDEIEAGRFREDLFYRLNVVNIDIPPLRERKEDIPLLAEKFLLEFSKEYNKNLKFLDIEAINYLVEFDWKGNVRELRNIMERAVLFADLEEEFLLKDYLPEEVTGIVEEESNKHNIEMSLQEYEKIIIMNTLKRHKGNKSKTSKILGIKRQTLYNKIKQYNINM